MNGNCWLFKRASVGCYVVQKCCRVPSKDLCKDATLCIVLVLITFWPVLVLSREMTLGSITVQSLFRLTASSPLFMADCKRTPSNTCQTDMRSTLISSVGHYKQQMTDNLRYSGLCLSHFQYCKAWIVSDNISSTEVTTGSWLHQYIRKRAVTGNL